MNIKLPHIHRFRNIKFVHGRHGYSDRLNFLQKSATLPVPNLSVFLDVKHYIEWLEEELDKNTDFRTSIFVGSVNIYTNDIAILQRCVDAISKNCTGEIHAKSFKFYFADPRSNYNSEVIYHAHPKHKYRIYLKSRKYEPKEIEELVKFLQKYQIYPSPSLSIWVNKTYPKIINGRYYNQWCFDSYYFDHDDDMITTLAALKFEIRKVCEIVKR